MDAEALQAQIDLSNSIAYDLVSSWVKPSRSSATSISCTISRELEEFARRPPRLGLGATVSQSSLSTLREAARLKGKLVGHKRQRDGSIDHCRVMAPEESHNSKGDEDEDESRSVAISSKKPRVKKNLGKEPKVMEISTKFSINPNEISAEGESHNIPSTLSNAPVGAPDPTLLISSTTPMSSTTHLISPAGLRPPSSPHQIHSIIHSAVALQSPLLNLHCPPSVQMKDEMLANPQVECTSPKKKKRRRRRGKGRKSHGGEEAG